MTDLRRAGQLLFLLASLAPWTAGAAQQSGPRLFLSVDMEGITGVVTAEQLGPSGFEYQRFREIMTREVLAAIRGARAAGVGEIVIADAHGNGQNLLLELLPADVQVVRAWPRPHGMMQGIDSTFDAAFLIGYHASTTNPEGVRAHTLSSARLADVRLNGRSVPEAALSGAIAGHFGVPVVLVTGGDAAVAEAREHLGDIEGVVVKWNYGFHSARTLMPTAANARIEAAADAAIRGLAGRRTYEVETPVTLEVRFKSYRPAEVAAYLEVVDRVDAHSIRYVGDDILEISRFLQFLTNYSATLEP
jgi:D-amino peptidase